MDFLISLLSRLFPKLMNRLKIDIVVSQERRQRPHPFSLWTGMHTGLPPTFGGNARGRGGLTVSPFRPSAYVSWPGLVDRSYTGRHLPPTDAAIDDLPSPKEVVETVFLRQGPMRPCKKTSALFCFFAQWFTDSFLRTHPIDRRRHTGNNEIDYCQIYGLDEATAFALRARTGGLMLMRGEPGRELPPLLILRQDLADGSGQAGEIDPRFRDLSYIDGDPAGTRFREKIEHSLGETSLNPSRWDNMYATGLDRGNSTVFYTSLSTMCLREHNRIARKLNEMHPEWEDDQLFETARIVNIHNVLEIVTEDYINHIAGSRTFALDRNFAERRPWYRTNRISIEFNLLYRWHSLVPDEVSIGGNALDHLKYRFNNAVLEANSPETLINEASRQPAGRIGLYNTPRSLAKAEEASISLGREFRLQSFNAYCERFRHKTYATIEELVGGDQKAAGDLNRLYNGDINKIDFIVGLFAEGRTKGEPDAALPPLLRKMVAVDAFTHILTNPVLSGQVHEAAFSGDLEPLISDTGGVTGLMRRNSSPGGSRAVPSFAV